MAFTEGKLQMIDLLGALQAKRSLQDDIEAQRQRELQNKLLQEQLEAAKWENLKSKEVPTMTVPSSGLTGMPTKKFLHEMTGYISGVDPTTVFNQWNQNFRQGMVAGGGGGRGYGRDDQQQAQPAMGMDYIGPDHSAAPTTVQAAQNLGDLMEKIRTPGPATLPDILADEQANKAGMSSLVNQFESRNAPYYVADKDMQNKISAVRDTANIPTPIQDALGKSSRAKRDAADLYIAGGEKPKEGMFTDAEMTNLVKSRQDAAAARKGGGGTVNFDEIKSDPYFKNLSAAGRAAIASDPKVADMIKRRVSPDDILIYLATTYGKK